MAEPPALFLLLHTFKSLPTKNHMLLASSFSPTTSHRLSPSIARFRMVFLAMRTCWVVGG